MKTLTVQIVLQSPTLLAAAPPASNLTETLLFVPGNTVRGVLAYRSLDQGRNPSDNVFQRLFVQGEARFGCACINGALPIPLSARSCKYDPGFTKDSGGHGMIDLLLAGNEEKRCTHVLQRRPCGQAVDYAQGFYDPHGFCKVSVKTRLITRTAIDPTRGAARTGQLYSQRVLAEEQIFVATVEVSDELHASLQALLNPPFPSRLGTGGSRGQGWVQVSQRTNVNPNWGTAADRFQWFRAKAGRPVLAVTLLSDGLFHDDYLRDTTAPSLDDLIPLGIDPKDWNPDPHARTGFMDTRLIFGFDGEPIRLPRQPRLAVAAGSVFLFRAKDGVSPTIPAGNGIGWIGDRNNEGYGRAVLWHPFHLTPEGGQP